MLNYLTSVSEAGVVPIHPMRKPDWESWIAKQAERIQRWTASTGYTAESGAISLISGPDGALERVLVGVGEEGSLWDWAALPGRLPDGTYQIEANLARSDADCAALGWALGTYGFDRYRKREGTVATLVWPPACDREGVERAARATFLVRDLINTPASDMGPEHLADRAMSLAQQHGAKGRVIVGDDLLAENYPAVHSIGRASDRPPCLIDVEWGDEKARKVTLVGKGVCFDTGGLNLKSEANMKLMKKDMGGAAHVLGLASMVMSAGIPLRLRVLIPAVENSVSGKALRPLDVVSTRKGLTVEITNTDAEGRVILADALAEAEGEKPEILIDFATLTGAARVALGPEVPALFSNDDDLAQALLRHGAAEADPLWRLPLWKPYRKQLDSKVASLSNASSSPYAGSITGALFLAEFVGSIPWIHLDVMAWNVESRAGRPEGGEAQGMRAAYALLEERFSR